MQVVQTLLKRTIATGTEQKVCWLPVRPDVKPGVVVSLKDEESRWVVAEQYATTDSDNIQRGWGLNLPKSQRTER